MKQLTKTTSKSVTEAICQIFTRFGILEVTRSHNGPQFASAKFGRFTKEWGIRHITSSPYNPQSNGKADCTMKTVKNFMRKSTDISQALLAHQTTLAFEGYSPGELMGQRLRSTVLLNPTKMNPKWHYTRHYKRRRKEMQAQEAVMHNCHHRTRNRPELDRRMKV